MKILPYLLLLLSLGIVSAAPEPEELLRLRKAWEKSLSDADRRAKDLHKSKTHAANKLYYEELQEMKSNFMKAENLQAAIAVNKEIEKLKALHGKQEFEPIKEGSPLDGVWRQYIGKKRFTKTIKGYRILDETGISQFRFENGVFKALREDGYWWELKANPDNPDVMEGVGKSGEKTKWVKVKW